MILPALVSLLFFSVPPLNVPDHPGAPSSDPLAPLNGVPYPASLTLKEVEKVAKTFVGIPKAKFFAKFDGAHPFVEERGGVTGSYVPLVSSSGFGLGSDSISERSRMGGMLLIGLEGLKKGHKYLVVVKAAGSSVAQLGFTSAAASATLDVPTTPSLLPIGFVAFGKKDGFLLQAGKSKTKYTLNVRSVEIYSLED